MDEFEGRLDLSALDIEARVGFFGKSVICRLSKDHVELLRGELTSRIGYPDLSSVRVFRAVPGQAVIGLVCQNGSKTTIRLAPSSGSDGEISAFTTALVNRVARVAPMTRLHLGPSRRQWIIAWVGVIVSSVILLASVWSFAREGSVGSLLLPLGIAMVNLVVVMPIVKSERPREQVVGTLDSEVP